MDVSCTKILSLTLYKIKISRKNGLDFLCIITHNKKRSEISFIHFYFTDRMLVRFGRKNSRGNERLGHERRKCIRSLCCAAVWAALMAAALSDVREYRIPNRVIFLGMAAGFLGKLLPAEGAAVAAAWADAGGFLLRAAFVTVLCFPFFLMKMTGGGDIKILALIVGWLGFKPGAYAFAAGLILGAVLALCKLRCHGSAGQRFLYFTAYLRQVFHDGKRKAYYDVRRDGRACVIPLGACFAAGALFVRLCAG
jgi:Flp pilus assembly protein protease CpaA